MPMSAQQLQALKDVADVIIELVKAKEPHGLPSGELYAVMMSQGWSLLAYQTFMEMLVAAGKLTVSNHLYKLPKVTK
jgi:hypothetical protein